MIIVYRVVFGVKADANVIEMNDKQVKIRVLRHESHIVSDLSMSTYSECKYRNQPATLLKSLYIRFIRIFFWGGGCFPRPDLYFPVTR